MVYIVTPHNTAWKDQFLAEATAIEDAMDDVSICLHHIGSTAVPGLLAKPIIDLLGIVADLRDIDEYESIFKNLGYQAMGAFGIEGRRYFRKLNTDGERTHHLHIFVEGSPHIERHLAFRDYLIAHPGAAAEYAALKQELVRNVGASWDAYLEGKDPFIRSTEKKAVSWFKQRQRTLNGLTAAQKNHNP